MMMIKLQPGPPRRARPSRTEPFATPLKTYGAFRTSVLRGIASPFSAGAGPSAAPPSCVLRRNTRFCPFACSVCPSTRRSKLSSSKVHRSSSTAAQLAAAQRSNSPELYCSSSVQHPTRTEAGFKILCNILRLPTTLPSPSASTKGGNEDGKKHPKTETSPPPVWGDTRTQYSSPQSSVE